MKAIDEDERSDRAISLAAGLGPNFVGQLRGTKSIPPKKPSIEYVRKLAQALNKELSEIIGDAEDDAEQRLRTALIAFGVDEKDLSRAVAAIRAGFVKGAETPEQTPPDDRRTPASRRRESTPS